MELQLNFVHVDADMISDHDFLLNSLQSQGWRPFGPSTRRWRRLRRH